MKDFKTRIKIIVLSIFKGGNSDCYLDMSNLKKKKTVKVSTLWDGFIIMHYIVKHFIRPIEEVIGTFIKQYSDR